MDPGCNDTPHVGLRFLDGDIFLQLFRLNRSPLAARSTSNHQGIIVLQPSLFVAPRRFGGRGVGRGVCGTVVRG